MIPKLYKQHPNFFIIYVATAFCLHLGMGYTQLYHQERYVNTSYEELYDVMPLHMWGWASLIVFLIMLIGMYFSFHLWARLGLSLGFFLCLSRGLLLELGPGPGGGMFVWGLLAILHFTQLSEPQHNPITAKG